jgi:hypothetical protein
MTGESAFGRGGGDHTAPPAASDSKLWTDTDPAAVQAREGAAHATNITATVDANALRDAEANRIKALQDRQAIDDKDVADSFKYKPLEQERAAIDSGQAKPKNPHQAIQSTIRNLQGPEATAEEPSSVGAPTPVPPKPTPSPKITPEFEPGYSGKAGKVLQYNLDQYNATQTSKGGEGNNVAGQNLPLSVKNPWIEEFMSKQAIIYQ